LPLLTARTGVVVARSSEPLGGWPAFSHRGNLPPFGAPPFRRLTTPSPAPTRTQEAADFMSHRPLMQGLRVVRRLGRCAAAVLLLPSLCLATDVHLVAVTPGRSADVV